MGALAFFFFLLFGHSAYAETLEDQLNNLVGPTEQYNTMLSPVYLRSNTTEEQISPQSGDLTISQTDYVLPGRNGLNVELKRIYKNSSSNVQEMKVKYVNGAWVDYVYSDAKTSSFYEDRYNLGIGTRFSFPSMEIRTNSDGTSHKFLHTDSGDVYRLKANTSNGQSTYLPEGQTVQDIVVKETTEYTNGQTDGTSKYVMTGKDGKKTYFTEDGRVVGIVDRYGNTIKFDYTAFTYTIDGQARTRKLMTAITDTIGRVITLEYKEDEKFTVKPISSGTNNSDPSYLASQNPNNTDSGDLGGKFQVIAHVPGGQTIVYDKSAVLVSSSKHVIRTRLQRVYDLDGKVKYHFWYEQPDLGFTFMNGSQYAVYNRYENLVQIDYAKTNRIKRYVYNTYTSGLNEKGSMQYRKVFEQKELVKKGYDPAQSNFLDRFATEEKDKTHYSYTGEPDGYGTTGYKDNDYTYLKDTFRYYSEATDVHGSTVKYTYDGIHELLVTEKNGQDHKEVLKTERDEMKLVKKQESDIYQITNGKETGTFFKKIENFRYDQYGNLTNYTGPEAARDEKGYPVDNEHTVIYSYDYDHYHVLNQKTWKTDSSTTSQILYDIDSKGNVIKETRLVGGENAQPVLTLFHYDAYGNMIRKEAKTGEQGGQSFVTEYTYGMDGNGADVKGAYLTEERVHGGAQDTVHKYAYDMNRGSMVSEWDGNGNRTVYEYDVLGRVLKQTAADGTAKLYDYREYPFKNQEIQITDPKGNDLLNQYDITGNLVRKDIRADGQWIFQYAAEYGNKGNKTKETDANGHSTGFEYDSQYRLIAKTAYENGTINRGTVQIAYAVSSDPGVPLTASITDEEGYVKKYYYDPLNRLVKLEETPDRVHFVTKLYSYDYTGNKVSETDARGNVTVFTYDDLGRMIGKKDALGHETRLTYNALQQVVKQQDPGGKVTESEYDGAGRVVQTKVYSESSPATYTYTSYDYDAAGNTIRMRKGQVTEGANLVSSDTRFDYDSLNRISNQYQKVDEARTFHSRISYDANGNKSRIIQYANAEETQYRIYEYKYDYAGRVTEETGAYKEYDTVGTATDHGSYKKSYVFDAAGNMLQEQHLNAAGGMDTTTYTYDYRNQVAGKTMPYVNGQVKRVQYQYDKTGNKTSESLEIGGVESVVTYSYDGLGRLLKQTDAMGNSIRYMYDAVGNRVKQVDARYVQSSVEEAPGIEYEYDANNRLVRTVAFDGATRFTVSYREYDARGNVSKEVAGEGYREENPALSVGSEYIYDVNDRRVGEVSAQTAADNALNGTHRWSQTYTYDGVGNLLTKTDAMGRVTQYAYYDNGLLKSRTDPDGLTDSFDYDLSGKAYTIATNRAGHATVSYMNIFDKPYRVEYPDGTVQTFEYSPKGELLQGTDQTGGITYFEYDASGNSREKREWIRSDGDFRYFKVTRSEYDEANRLTAAETFLQKEPLHAGLTETLESAGDRVENAYDKAGRLIRISGPNSRETLMDYDRAGQLIARKSEVAEGVYEVKRYEYDLLAHLVKEILLVPTSDLSMNDVANAKYDEEYYDRLQSIATYKYDKSGHMISATDPNGNTTMLVYDLDGRLLSKTDPVKSVISYKYDNNGNMTEEKNANGVSTYYEYDALNRLIRRKDPAAGEGMAVTRYVLDAMGNVVKTILPNQYQASLDKPDTVTSLAGISYTYDVMNRRISTVSPDGKGMEYIRYNGKGLLVKRVDGLRWNGSMDTSEGTEYVYNELGWPTSKTDAAGNTSSIEYDVLGHMVRLTNERGNATLYAYNPDGTLQQVQYPDGGITTYSYDRLGRLLTETNPLGNTISYNYNAFGKVKSTTDAYSQKIQVKTDLTGNPVSSTDKRGSMTLFKYDSLNRLSEKRTPLERDASGNIVYAVEKYSYDAVGNMIRKALAGTGSKDKSFLRETLYAYYDNNLLRTQSDNSGALSRYYYDLNGNKTKAEKLRDTERYDVEKLEYDNQNRVTKDIRLVEKDSLDGGETYASAAALRDEEYPDMIRLITGYEYDVLGNRVKEIAPRAYAYDESDKQNRDEHTTVFSYDVLNRLSSRAHKDHGADVQIQYAYDESGNRISTENEKGAIVRYAYDAMNRAVSMTDAEGNIFTYAYDLAGNKLRDTNALGNIMSYSYDKLNRVLQVTDPFGVIVTRYVYDANGNTIKKMDASGILSGDTDEKRYGTEYEYDQANRLVKETDPELASINDDSWFSYTYRYNPAGDMLEKTDALGFTTKYTYNEAGLLTAVTDARQVTTSYQYDKAGNKLVMTDGRGKTTSYRYGAFGLLLEAVNAAGRTESYLYNLGLQTAVLVDGNVNHTRYHYDNMNRLVEKSVAETGDRVIYAYDAIGNRSSMTDGSGESAYVYDRNNRLLQVNKDGPTQVAYTYDAIGNVRTVTDKLGGTTEYSYDLSSRMKTVKADGKTTTYEYDENGNRKSVTYPGGVSEEYTYDKAYRLLQVVNRSPGGSTISQYTYTYDEAGQQISKTDSYGKTAYAYDEVGRIYRVDAPGKTTFYSYDDAGNRQSLQETYTSAQPSGYTDPNAGTETEYWIKKSDYLYAKDNQLLKLSERMLDASGKDVLEKTTEYLYDGNGNELRQKVSYVHPHSKSMRQTTGASPYGESVNGDPNAVIEKVSNAFDGFNQLILSERVKNEERVTIGFVYNGDGLRTQRTVKSSKDNYAAKVTNYLYDRQYVILETDANDALSTRYVRGINYISRTSGNTDASSSAAHTSYFLFNGHGDVVQTVSEDGTVENQYDYDIFGNPTLTIEQYANSVRYAGEFYDAESGLYYLRARYYNPYTGRFISEDSYWGEDNNPLSLNRYTYGHNNPVMFVDPTGHSVLSFLSEMLFKPLLEYVFNQAKNSMIQEVDKQKQIWAEEEKGAGKNQTEFTPKQNEAHEKAEQLKAALASMENAQAKQMLGQGDGAEEDWEGYKALNSVRQEPLKYDPVTVNTNTQKMQQRLNELGYSGSDGKPLAENGVFNSDTLFAVNHFKDKNKLGNDGQYQGKVGETTWGVLFSNSAFHAKGIGMILSPGMNSGSSAEYVTAMQTRLTELGYYGSNKNQLSINGVYDEDTLYAVNLFKERNQLWNSGQYNGIVGDTTWIALNSANAVHAPPRYNDPVPTGSGPANAKKWESQVAFLKNGAANGDSWAQKELDNERWYVDSDGKTYSYNEVMCASYKTNCPKKETSNSNLSEMENFSKESITSTWGISNSTVEAWFLDQKSAQPVIKRYGLNSTNIGAVTAAVEANGVSPVFFYAYTVNEGGGAGGFINHYKKSYYSNNGGDTAVNAASGDAKYLASQSKIMNSQPAWIDAGNPVDFVPQSTKNSGNASFANMPSGSIGRAYIPATAATTWEVYYPNGLLKEYNTVQNYGAPMQGVMNSITAMGGKW